MADSQTTSSGDAYFYESLGSLLRNDVLTSIEKMQNFPKYVPRQYLSYFLMKYEIFKKILGVHGSIIECGVFQGGGLLTWAQLSAIFEPVNHQRRIIGFDTFEGFPSIASQDHGSETDHRKAGGMATYAESEIREAIRVFDSNRSIAHIPKVDLVVGDATQTIPAFLQDNPHVVVSLLVLDMDIYEPTLAALRAFLPRIPAGGIILFDELNAPQWPGETRAVLEEVGLSRLRLERFPFDSGSCYAILDGPVT